LSTVVVVVVSVNLCVECVVRVVCIVRLTVVQKAHKLCCWFYCCSCWWCGGYMPTNDKQGPQQKIKVKKTNHKKTAL